ncbi:Meiotically up-regulated protein 86 protein [Malassezia yamatoensis]|uniref:Meiotically up-regulated protein 86 protein n=1 Tax=Malassezia yamatoensis TaxID=253288 RepID=A0AAJ5Z0X6_9BASI|nr:Meiotically up-regulated protein 86 protein [Malassezia yamatoensis]
MASNGWSQQFGGDMKTQDATQYTTSEVPTQHTTQATQFAGQSHHEGRPQPMSNYELTRNMSQDERQAAFSAARFGYGPLAHTSPEERANMLPAFGGEMQPGLYKGVKERKFANPAPLGLAAFALTTFVLSLINLGTRGVTSSSIIISLAFAYGGLVQLLAGMWEMAVGNTFGATALSSYGGFWIAFAILLTPGGFGIASAVEQADGARGLNNEIGFFLMGWFIFTFLLLLCTLKSTVAFCMLFFLLDITFLCLGVGHLVQRGGKPHSGLIKAGGVFGILTAFVAWYNAFAGLADESNSFFITPVVYFPWTERGKKQWAVSKKDTSSSYNPA